MSSSTLLRDRPLSRPAGLRALSGAALMALGLALGACAQTRDNRMGGAGEGYGTDASQPMRSERERPRQAPGDINRTDSNVERSDAPTKSGPPSAVKPVQ